MCGLTGWISTHPERFGDDAERALTPMQRALEHRGPDGYGAHVDRPRDGRSAGVVMGFARLAIRDTLHGAQPMHGGDLTSRRVISAVNGEIYREVPLDAALAEAGVRRRTRCDAELVAHGAAVWGDAVWPRLDGMFAAAVWEPEAGALTFSRDEAGMKPLYVAVVDDQRTVLWGSELGALLAHPALTPRLDPRALRALLWLDYVPSPGSMLQGVYKLPPGASWRVQANDSGRFEVTTSRWGSPTPEPTPPPSKPLKELEEALDDAVRERLVSDVPLCVFLSGGVDSSLVAMMARRHLESLHTLSVRFEETSFDESRYAQEVAAHLGAQHQEVLFRAADGLAALESWLDRPDEPLADPSLLVTAHLCRHASADFTVALGGDGGDEAWLGYPTFTALPVAEALSGVPTALWRGLDQGLRRVSPGDGNLPWVELAQRFNRGLADEPALRHLNWIGGQPLTRAASLTPDLGPSGPWDAAVGWQAPRAWIKALTQRLPAAPPARRDSALLSHTYLADGVLQKVDRASMAHGLEVRAPWLDRRVRALAASMAPSQHRRRGRGKLLPRALAAKHLPSHVATRKKKGFGVPLAAWFRGPLRDALTAELAGSQVGSALGVPKEAMDALLSEHLSGAANHQKTLFALWRVSRWWRAIA